VYDYRRMTAEERERIVRERRERGFPLHAPPHLQGVAGEYLITAACYEHCHVFESPDELSWLTEVFLSTMKEVGFSCMAWVFLPNHYHLLLETQDLSPVGEVLRKLHSRTATRINGRQNQRGRRVWYRYSDRLVRSERHHWATVNYIHYNPVKHGYVAHMADWPWSGVHELLATWGRPRLEQVWSAYPVGEYGKGWDW